MKVGIIKIYHFVADANTRRDAHMPHAHARHREREIATVWRVREKLLDGTAQLLDSTAHVSRNVCLHCVDLQ